MDAWTLPGRSDGGEDVVSRAGIAPRALREHQLAKAAIGAQLWAVARSDLCPRERIAGDLLGFGEQATAVDRADFIRS